MRENFTLEYWEDNLGNNQVAIDREGDPLHYIITTEALPELPEEITFKISAMVLKSLQRYYKNNAITGKQKTLKILCFVICVESYHKLTQGYLTRPQSLALYDGNGLGFFPTCAVNA